jgi:hypothetical protein
VEGLLICRLQPLVHWEFMGLRTLRFRNYDDDTQKSQACFLGRGEASQTITIDRAVRDYLVERLRRSDCAIRYRHSPLEHRCSIIDARVSITASRCPMRRASWAKKRCPLFAVLDALKVFGAL